MKRRREWLAARGLLHEFPSEEFEALEVIRDGDLDEEEQNEDEARQVGTMEEHDLPSLDGEVVFCAKKRRRGDEDEEEEIQRAIRATMSFG